MKQQHNHRTATFARKGRRAEAKSAALPLALAGALIAAGAFAQFVEPDVVTLELFEGDEVGDNFGWVGAAIGDLNADGVREILIPAISRDGGAGRVTVYSGADGAVLNQIDGAPGDLAGYAVGDAGDVNGDRVGDYIVGGARVFVVSGADHSELLDVTATTGFGYAVAGAGDLNGDGSDDLLVGSQIANEFAGTAYALSGADGSILWQRDGESAGDLLGSGAGGVGDVTQDGVPDVVVAAFGAGLAGGGLAFVLDGVDGSVVHTLQPEDPFSASVFGQFFASGAGDVDGDGVGDVFIGDYNEGLDDQAGTGRAYIFSGRNGRRLHVFDGRSTGEGFGPGRGIPDVNGDGHADIVVAAYTNSDAALFAGKTYLFSGRSGALLRTITADVAFDNFGVDALAVGDSNGDGLTDFLVTAVGLSFAGTDTGRAYLIAGTVLPCVADLNEDDRVSFADLMILRNEFGKSDSPADLNGDGAVDFDDARVLLADVGDCPAGS